MTNSITKEELKGILKIFIERSLKKDSLNRADIQKIYRGLKIKASFGQGNQAKTSWMAFLGPDQKPLNGIYPLILSNRKDCIVVAYGVSELVKPELSWKGSELIPLKESECRCDIKEMKKRYKNSYLKKCIKINSKTLDKTLNAVVKSLDSVIDEYLKLFSKNGR